VSFQAMAWAVKQTVGDVSAKWLLVTLANYADEHGKCWPSLNRLASDTELSRATILRKLEYLYEKRLVSREQKPTKAGTYNEYTLCQADTPSITVTLPRYQGDTPPSITVTPNPIREPIKEPVIGAQKRATPIPDDFPSEAEIRWTLKEHPNLSAWEERDKFRDYAAQHGKTYKDWTAAWRTWCRNATTWAKERNRRFA
jgi:DNA-binding transcriptional MocR family regulator